MSSALTPPRHTSTSQAVAAPSVGWAHSSSQKAHHAAPAGKDVWHNSDAPIPQHGIPAQSAGAIGCLHNVLAVHLAGHVSSYAPRSGCRDKHIAGDGEQLLQGQLLTCRAAARCLQADSSAMNGVADRAGQLSACRRTQAAVGSALGAWTTQRPACPQPHIAGKNREQ